jgi:hypothetical protein
MAAVARAGRGKVRHQPAASARPDRQAAVHRTRWLLTSRTGWRGAAAWLSFHWASPTGHARRNRYRNGWHRKCVGPWHLLSGPGQGSGQWKGARGKWKPAGKGSATGRPHRGCAANGATRCCAVTSSVYTLMGVRAKQVHANKRRNGTKAEVIPLKAQRIAQRALFTVFTDPWDGERPIWWVH